MGHGAADHRQPGRYFMARVEALAGGKVVEVVKVAAHAKETCAQHGGQVALVNPGPERGKPKREVES
jgi:hypothetical protein